MLKTSTLLQSTPNGYAGLAANLVECCCAGAAGPWLGSADGKAEGLLSRDLKKKAPVQQCHGIRASGDRPEEAALGSHNVARLRARKGRARVNPTRSTRGEVLYTGNTFGTLAFAQAEQRKRDYF
jgi:hypothetical protein